MLWILEGDIRKERWGQEDHQDLSLESQAKGKSQLPPGEAREKNAREKISLPTARASRELEVKSPGQGS